MNVKVHPRTGHKGPEGEWRYSSTLSVILLLDGCRFDVSHPHCVSFIH